MKNYKTLKNIENIVTNSRGYTKKFPLRDIIGIDYSSIFDFNQSYFKTEIQKRIENLITKDQGYLQELRNTQIGRENLPYDKIIEKANLKGLEFHFLGLISNDEQLLRNKFKEIINYIRMHQTPQTYVDFTKDLRLISNSFIETGSYNQLSLNNTNKIKVSLMARGLRTHENYETGKDSGGLDIGDNEICVIVRGNFLGENNETYSLARTKEDDAIMIKLGSKVKNMEAKVPKLSIYDNKSLDLIERVNKIGNSYNNIFLSLRYFFVRDILEECNKYANEISPISIQENILEFEELSVSKDYVNHFGILVR